MKERLEGYECKLTREIFDKSLLDLKKKNGDKYKFILRAGSDYRNALYNLFKKVWSSEEKPDQWNKTTIVQLYKGKGDHRMLSNIRHIHIKMDIPKMFGHMILSQVKAKIMNEMTKFQIGTKGGHRVQEHLFTIKSIVALYTYLNIPIIIQYTISQNSLILNNCEMEWTPSTI